MWLLLAEVTASGEGPGADEPCPEALGHWGHREERAPSTRRALIETPEKAGEATGCSESMSPSASGKAETTC